MASLRILRHYVKQRLTSAAEEIFAAFEKTIAEYQEEITRQRQLLEDVNRQRTDPAERRCSRGCDAQKVLVKQEVEEEEPRLRSAGEGCCSGAVETHVDDVGTMRCSSAEPSSDRGLFLRDTNVERSRGHPHVTGSPGREAGLDVLHRDSDPVPVEWYQEGPKKEMDSFCEERSDGSGAASCPCPVEGSGDTEAAPPSSAAGVEPGPDSGGASRAAPRLKRRYKTRPAKVHLQCPFCELQCKYNSQLVRHMRIHTNERPFQCAVCGKYFKNRRHVVEHMVIHSGEKPHLCNVCGKSFTHRFSMTRHIKSHSGNKSLWCVACGKWFHGHVGFNKHMKIHREEQSCSRAPADSQEATQGFGLEVTLEGF